MSSKSNGVNQDSGDNDFHFHRGQYVRIKAAPASRIGTVQDIKSDYDGVHYLFRLDPRLHTRTPGPIYDVWIPEYKLENLSPFLRRAAKKDLRVDYQSVFEG